jgi:hypothetical protein
MEQKRTWGRILQIVLLIGLLLFLLLLLRGCDSKYITHSSPIQAKTIRQMAAETPVFPGFKELQRSEAHKDTNALLTIFYESDANYVEVKSFYSKALSTVGWGAPMERGIGWHENHKEFEYRRDEYVISVEYIGGDKGSSGWDYAVSYAWNL